MLTEGSSIRSIERLTSVHRDTIMRQLVRVGSRCREFLDQRLRNLHLKHLQCDEIWTFVRKKQGRIPSELTHDEQVGDQFLFVALDEVTKLIATFAIGKRNGETAQRFMNDLASRLVLPDPDDLGPRPQLSTDGFNVYPRTVAAAFGNRIRHGVIIKTFRESEQPGRYGPPVLENTTRRVISGSIPLGMICTSHVERSNLSIRTFVKRFARLSLGFSKKLENLAAAVALHVASYNFCRLHRSLPGTPAMIAGLAGHPWTVEELMENL